METKEYRTKLTKVLRRIENHFDIAEIRGSDHAGFIYAEKGNRAIELYQSKTAVIVEFWENEEQQTEKETDYYEIATEMVINWIKTDYEN